MRKNFFMQEVNARKRLRTPTSYMPRNSCTFIFTNLQSKECHLENVEHE